MTTTSGNGLKTTVVTDFTGDGNADRAVTMTRLADGSWTETSTLYYPGSRVTEGMQRSQSADGRTVTTTRDLNGDGKTDRSIVAVTDLSSNLQVDYKDVRLDGTRSILITEKVSANGLESSFTFDVDNDSKSDFARFTDVTFLADGSSVETFREIYEANAAIYGTYGAKKVVYSEVTTRSADGLQSVTEIDTDGDGVVDAVTTETTFINQDGSRKEYAETYYTDGELRSRFENVTSADGRQTVTTADYDGNGIADKVSDSRVLADGSRQVVDTSFGQGGAKIQTFVTTTSADGLVTRITRGAVEQVITRSATDPDSYTWTNGVAAATTATNVVVSHQIDALGIETWTMTSKWYVSTTLNTTVSTVRLDAAAKERVLAEAARIFDTVLDRDMDVTEIEMLVPKIANGQLDELALATELLASSEFVTRYGTLSNAEFVTQVYLNALGRVPSLVELSETLGDLAAGRITRAKFAAGVSEGIEHVVVGNGHMSTNNFDVIMNPAVFERSLDEAYVRDLVESAGRRGLRPGGDGAGAGLPHKPASEGHRQPRRHRGEASGGKGRSAGGGDEQPLRKTGATHLFGKTGADLVEQGFVNALGRQPTAQEQAIWEAHLASGRITVAQFVATLAMSMDALSVGPESVATVLPTVTALTGTTVANTLTGTAGQDLISGLAGNDTLSGGDGSDVLQGGVGADSLNGQNGNDFYEWAKGDGNDTINDTATTLLEYDRLQLIDVASTDVVLSRASGGVDMIVTILSTGETITVLSQVASITQGTGLEEISFSDGETWSLQEMLAQLRTVGTSAGETLVGRAFKDDIRGMAGNDVIVAGMDDDIVTGGLGIDTIWGGANGTTAVTNGNDTYVWAKGDGNDVINDWGQSLAEVDTLRLTDVDATDVALSFSNSAGADLLVTILSTGEVIRIDERYQNLAYGYGIERIEFSDGVIWNSGRDSRDCPADRDISGERADRHCVPGQSPWP